MLFGYWHTPSFRDTPIYSSKLFTSASCFSATGTPLVLKIHLYTSLKFFDRQYAVVSKTRGVPVAEKDTA